MALELLRPELFWPALLAVPVCLALRRRSRAGSGPGRRRLVAALRISLLLLLAFALGGPVWQGQGGARVVVVAEDASGSLEGAAAGPAAAAAAELARLLPPPARVERIRFGGPDDTDLEAALRLAGTMIPEGAAGAVLLVSDGVATAGRPRRAAVELGLRGVPVHTVAAARAPRADAFPERAVLPEPWWPGGLEETVLVLTAGRAGPGTVAWRVDEEPEESREVELAPGPNRVVVPVRVNTPGRHLLEVAWRAGWDEEPANDRLAVPFAVQEPFRVVWCRGVPGRPEELLAGAGFTVEKVEPGALAARLGERPAPDLVVLDDAPAAALGPAALERVRELVTAGGTGLLLGGARSSFGPGGYGGTVLEPLLPVLLEQREERRDPSVSLALIVDTSGSMGDRVELAKEVARLTLRRLKPHDKAGIVEFYGHKRWAAPIQPASNQIDILRALNRLQSGGGTVLMPAIEEAYHGLLNVATRFKHVLILTDGGVEQGAFEPLVRRMAEQGLTISTVLVGPGRDSEFLLNLAQWGRGRYYQAPGRFHLPEVNLKQPTSAVLPPFLSGPLAVRTRRPAPDLEGLDLAAAPPLAGAVETRSRAGAEVLLEAAGGAPLLCRWRHGLGRIVCWTTETQGPMLGGWAGWDGYGRLLRRVLREACRRTGRPWLEAGVERRGMRLAVTARVMGADGRPEAGGSVAVSQGGRLLGRLVQYAPGRFEAGLPLAGEEEPLAVAAAEGLTRLLAVPPERARAERAGLGPDRELLAALRAPAGGLEDPGPGALAAALADPGRRGQAFLLAPWLLLLAALVYLLELLLRRLPAAAKEGP